MYNIVICDDNEIFCFQLEDILNRIFKERPTPPRITMFNEAEKLEEYIANDMSIDLLFLDIEFHSESLNGVNIAQFCVNSQKGKQHKLYLFPLRVNMQCNYFKCDR